MYALSMFSNMFMRCLCSPTCFAKYSLASTIWSTRQFWWHCVLDILQCGTCTGEPATGDDSLWSLICETYYNWLGVMLSLPSARQTIWLVSCRVWLPLLDSTWEKRHIVTSILIGSVKGQTMLTRYTRVLNCSRIRLRCFQCCMVSWSHCWHWFRRTCLFKQPRQLLKCTDKCCIIVIIVIIGSHNRCYDCICNKPHCG